MDSSLLCLGYMRQRVGERSTQQAFSRCSSGMRWVYFILFCISKLLASKDRTSLDERRLCRARGLCVCM